MASSRVPAAASPDAPPWLLAYRLEADKPLRYRLQANIKANMPLFDSATPSDLNILITLVYNATPKTVLEDGTMDVEFVVDSVEAELEKLPLPVALEQVQQVLNQTVTLDRTGAVKKIQGGGPLPFDVAVPGVDPKRLYALLFPIVFQTEPVNIGDRWEFKSELLASDVSGTTFTATVLPPAAPAKPAPPKKGSKPTARPKPAPPNPNITRLREQFSMNVDNKLDADKKPVTGDAAVHRTQQGRIEGNGVFDFDRAKGRFTKGVINITADIKENLVGEPISPTEPKERASKVRATVTVELQPAAPAPTESDK